MFNNEDATHDTTYQLSLNDDNNNNNNNSASNEVTSAVVTMRTISNELLYADAMTSAVTIFTASYKLNTNTPSFNNDNDDSDSSANISGADDAKLISYSNEQHAYNQPSYNNSYSVDYTTVFVECCAP